MCDVRGMPLDWFKSNLSSRIQFIQIEYEKSNLLDMSCGVPQGSTICPLLF